MAEDYAPIRLGKEKPHARQRDSLKLTGPFCSASSSGSSGRGAKGKIPRGLSAVGAKFLTDMLMGGAAEGEKVPAAHPTH